MRVRELIEILSRCDPDAPVATHANNYEFMSGRDDRTHGELRVVELHACYAGGRAERFVCIGNVGKQNLNGINWHAPKVLDGGDGLDREWFGDDREERTIHVGNKQLVCAACVADGLSGNW